MRSLLESFLIFSPSVFVFREIGRLILKVNFLTEFIVGISVSGLILTPVIWAEVSWAQETQKSIFLFGLLLVIIRVYKNRKRLLLNSSLLKRYWPKITYFTLIYLFVGVFFFNLSSIKHVFGAHDVMYFGWLQEVWQASYSGGVRVPTLWPLQLGSNNILPGTVLSLIATLQPDMNLVSAIDARYFIIVTTFFLVLKDLKLDTPSKMIKVFTALSISWLFFGTEIGTELNLSSYLYVLLLVVIIQMLMTKKSAITGVPLIILFSILLVAKTQIALVAAVVIIVLIRRIGIKALNPRILSLWVLISINMLFWLIIPSTAGSNIGIPLPFGFHPSIESGQLNLNLEKIYHGLDSLPGWYPAWEGGVVQNHSSGFVAILLIFLLISLKIYAVYFLAIQSVRIPTEHRKILDIFVAVSFFSWAVIRNGGHVGHQAHAFLTTSVVTAAVLAIVVFKFMKNSLILPSLVIAITLNLYAGTLPPLNEVNAVSIAHDYGMTTHDSKKLNPDEMSLTQLQIWNSINGRKMPFDVNGDYTGSQASLFSQMNP